MAASFTSYFAEAFLGPIYAIFVKNIGGDVFEAGATYAIFAIVSGIFIFTVGRSMFFKTHLRQMIVLGFGLFTLGGIGYLLVQNPIQLFILQIFMGLAEGILEPSWDGLFSADLTEEQSAHSWATFAGGKSILVGIGALVGGALVTLYSFHTLFYVVIFLNFLATLFSVKILWLHRTRAVS
jgi:hypothetical protein